MRRTVLQRSIAALGLALCLQGQGAATERVGIVDPVLNMTAWTLTVPSNWTAEGTMMPGSSCNSATTPIYKARSADGLSGAYFLPRTDWVWGSSVRNSPDCLPWHEVLSAKRYLTYLMDVEKVGFVRDETQPSTYNSLHGETSDSARYLVRYSVGGQLVDELLSATVSCNVMTMAVVGEQHSCSAFATRWYAPAGKIDAMLPAFSALHLTLDQQWWGAWQSALATRFRNLTEVQTARLLDQGRLAQAQRMQAHDAYMTSTQQGYDAHNKAFAVGQFLKQQRSDNFVDYVLDCTRLYSGTSRVSVGANCPNRQTP